ncbi:Ff.00g114430.m01.CDS01 [Fusarium sp. VM40]|nr:Ff.00g114430.m01.CDS01 [Fusarium sp. VM40]
MPDPAPENESAGSSRYSDSSATYVHYRRRIPVDKSLNVTFCESDTSGDELVNSESFRTSHSRKYSPPPPPPPPRRSAPKVGDPPIPRLSRSLSNFDQTLVPKGGFIQLPSRYEAESKGHASSNPASSPPKPTPHIRYPPVPDMSRPRPSSPNPVSPHYRGSRPNSYYGQPPDYRYVSVRERNSRTYSPSPPPPLTRDHQNSRYVIREVETRTYSPSPPSPRIRETYHPDMFRLEAELERYRARDDNFRFTRQQEIREAEIRKEVEENYKIQLEERKRVREEAKKELEQARLEAEKAAREKLETERKAEEAVRKREEDQAKRLEREIRLMVEAEKQAEEAEKKAKARMEENLELLMKTKMVEKFDDLLETAKERLQAPEKPSPSQRVPARSTTREKSKYDVSDGYTVDVNEVPYRDQSSRPVPSKPASYSYTTSSNRPEKDTLSPSEDEWEKVPRPVPVEVPDPPSFEFDSEEEDIPHPNYSRTPRWPQPYRDTSSRSRGRTRHRSHLSGISRYSQQSQDYQTPMSPDMVQQIARAVADILREPSYEDFMSQRSNHTDPLRRYSSRSTERSMKPSENSNREDYDIENRKRSHYRDNRERQQQKARLKGATSSSDKELDKIPSIASISRLRHLPMRENKPPREIQDTSDLVEDGHSLNYSNNTGVGVSGVKISVSDAQGLTNDLAEDKRYRDGDGMEITNSESMTQVNSDILVGGSKMEGHRTPSPFKAYDPEKDGNPTGGLLKTETARDLYCRTIGRGKRNDYVIGSYGGIVRSWPQTDASDVE